MELLVVISVVALLLAVLMPGLRKAKEMAGRVVCANNERQLATANNLYAANWDEQFCPPMMYNTQMPSELRKLNWLTNPDFRKYMALDDKQVSEKMEIMPDEYFCPADKVARYDEVSIYDVLCSYAYNVTDWNGEFGCYWPPVSCESPWQIGHKRTAIPRASEKINFTDSSDWWCTWWGANYVKAWDLVGHGSWYDYNEVGIWGPVLYRHSEGANFAFYDGHVEHLPKGKAFVDVDDDPSNGDTKDATGMWYVDESVW